MHPASSGVANIRPLWCPGNISQAERGFGGRRSMARRRNVAAGCGVIQRFAQSAEEVAMTYVRPACLALAFVATAVPASAQTWIYEQDVPRARVYEPRYEPRSYYEPGAYQAPTYESRAYEPRAYEPRAYEPRAYEPAVAAPPLALTPAQRTTIYRTIIPQGRGRGPIVRERIVTESVAPAPVVRERSVNPPPASAYAAVGSRVSDAYALAPMPQSVVATVPSVRSYRYTVINNRLLLVDPATGIVVAEVTD
jgi:hypothetical protein